jgi:hypothetical protein
MTHSAAGSKSNCLRHEEPARASSKASTGSRVFLVTVEGFDDGRTMDFPVYGEREPNAHAPGLACGRSAARDEQEASRLSVRSVRILIA